MSDVQNFCLDGKIFFISLDNYPKDFKFSGYKGMVWYG